MGNIFTMNMEENFKRNQTFITEINTIKMERQLQMRDELRQRQVALDLAKERELFFWYGAFYLTSLVCIFANYRIKKRLVDVSPVIPLTFLMAYQADLAYGTKHHRILVEAEHILQFESDLLELPLGVPTASSIDTKRFRNDELKKLHPLLPPL